MCGVNTAPHAGGMQGLGATKAELIKHSTSGYITGDLDSVVDTQE
jgi:predicted class III extradiol MEMO1 family dioxygenase